MKKIILLHGALGSQKDLEQLADQLTQLGFITYSFSFSGHGDADFEKDFGIEQFAKELHEFIEANSLQSAAVFGYSMGGYVALYLETLFPGRLKKIITLGTKFNWNEEALQKEIKTLNPEFLLEKAPQFAEKLKIYHGDRWIELLERTKDMMRELCKDDLLPPSQTQKIKSKVLLGLGDKDKMVSSDETKQKADDIPNGEMFTLSNVAHGIETADMKMLSIRIKEFLARN